MMKLNKAQQRTFEILLDIINHPRKALVFYCLRNDEFLTITDLRDRIESEYLDLDIPVKENIIYSYMEIFADRNRGLVEEKRVKREWPYRRLTNPKAWRLTEKGAGLQDIVAYGFCYLPVKHDIPSRAVIGAMNTAYERRASYARVDILLPLEYIGELSLGELSDFVEMHIIDIQLRLDELANIRDINGNKMPFVEPISGDASVTKRVYISTGQQFYKGDFVNCSQGLIDLAKKFSEAEKGKQFKAKDLLEKGSYKYPESIYGGLQTLKRKGYLVIKRAREFRTYRIMPIGRDYVVNCLYVIMGAIANLPLYVSRIREHQHSKEDIAKAVNTI